MANRVDYFDLHSHFLPAMDDGCKDCAESAALLQMSLDQGVVGMMATPHYYPKESVASFLARRRTSYDKLITYLDEKGLPAPDIALGAEVAYHPGLVYEEDLEKLRFGKSKYLLLEMPFTKWSSGVLKDVRAIHNVRGLTPIIAHLERYRNIVDKRMIEELIDSDVLIQMNAEYFLDWGTHGKAKKWLANVHVMGSDSHNLGKRKPNLGIALDKMTKERLYDYVEDITYNNEAIFEAACGQ